jgi:hypothetical protein
MLYKFLFERQRMAKKHVLILILLGLFLASSTPVSAQLKISPKSKLVLKQNINKLKLRNQKIAKALRILGRLIKQQMPRGLTPRQQREWLKQTKWFKSIRYRYSKYHRQSNQVILKSAGLLKPVPVIPGGQPLPNKTGNGANKNSGKQDGMIFINSITKMNLDFQAMQAAMQMESRKFQSVSNAIKTRHDIAMASIRNAK